jgi:hypothetical protein
MWEIKEVTQTECPRAGLAIVSISQYSSQCHSRADDCAFPLKKAMAEADRSRGGGPEDLLCMSGSTSCHLVLLMGGRRLMKPPCALQG